MRNTRRRKGLSLVDVLLSLMLVATLLASIAAAVHASLQSYHDNDNIASGTQSARMVIDRLAREVRVAQSVDSTASTLTITAAPDGSGLQSITYAFQGGKLNYTRVVNGTPATDTVLGLNDQTTVTAFQVLRELGQDSQGHDCTKSVTVRLTFTVDNQPFAVTATAAVRRNQAY